MGGSMYERRDPSGPPHSSLRDQIWAQLAAFGPFAVQTDTEGLDWGHISIPMRRAGDGEKVLALFSIASGPGAGADAPERLATLKPDSPGPYHAAFLITVLAKEMTEFARDRLLSGLAETIRSISLVQGTPHSVNVDGIPTPGWAILADGASGFVCEQLGRILMWVGTENSVMPRSISTKIMTTTGWQEDST